ncbi:MAG TPA: GNAT family N-acetyltransferase [Micromonosporaceae bacterium]|nr:GNAT family N-acetyltransferase [Micromonosporaceae bacterium]
MVREWDPWTASPAEIESVRDTLNAIIAIDMPDDPAWRETMLREYLAVTMPGERRFCWVAEGSAGDAAAGKPLVGLADVLLIGDVGIVEVLVHPLARRGGVGRELLAAAARKAGDEGFSSVAAEVVGGTPAVAFYESVGFRCAYIEMRSVLPLDGVDWLALGEMATGIGAGYRIEFHAGGLPEELIVPYAEAKQVVRDIDDGDLDLRPSSSDPDRLRASLTTLTARGMKPYIVVAIHERSGTVAGLTEVVTPVQHPTRADQYDTIVVPEHRGAAVGRAIKARMLFELRSAEPQLRDVQTWNAMENEPMLAVNAELGFKPDRQWREYEAEVADLVRRLAR